MPYKQNESCRHKFPKPNYRVTNWSDDNATLQQRGNLTIWFTEEAPAGWLAVRTGKRGAQPVYSDLAIETSLTTPPGVQAALAANDRLAAVVDGDAPGG